MGERSAVVDTNVAVSFLLFSHSIPADALRSLIQTHRLLASQATLAELRDVLRRDKFARIPLFDREDFLASYRATVEVIETHVNIDICVDPKDNKFLSLAVSGNAEILLTGDDHLLRLRPFRGIDILKPQEYLKREGIRPAR